MPRQRRTRIPGVPSDAERNIESIVREFEGRLLKLERKSGRPGFVSSDTAASAGEFLNVEAPAAGLTIILPEATPALRNARVTLAFRNTNPVKLVAIGGTVNREEFVVNTATGQFDAVCNGLDGWGVALGVSSSGSAVDAQYVLGAAHGSLPNGAVATDSTEINVTVAPGTTATWALIDGSIGLPRFANVAAGTFLGNVTASTGPVTANSLSTLAGAGLTYALGVMAVGAGTGLTVNADDVQLSAIGANSFFMNPTGLSAVPSAVAGSTVAGAGLTYTTGGILAVGAGTGLTVNANDVQLSTGAAETFFGNFTAGVAVGTYRAGSSVAGAGLTYTAGGTLAVGAGTRITVNADDVQLAAGAADSFLMNATAGSAVADYRAGASVAGAGLTYTTGGTLAVGAGTGITVNANDVQLSTLAAETFFGNFTASPAVGTGVAGSTVAGAGLTYTTGGILAVGAGTNVTVNANDVAVTNFPLTGLADQAANTFLGNVTALSGKPTAVPATTMAGAGLTYSIGGVFAVGAGTSMQVNADDVGYIGNTAEIVNATATGNLGTIDISTLSCGGTYRISAASAAFQIEGFTAKARGFWFVFLYEDTDAITLFNKDATAAATAQLALPIGLDIGPTSTQLRGIFFYTGSCWQWCSGGATKIGSGTGNTVAAEGSTVAINSSGATTITTGVGNFTVTANGSITLDASSIAIINTGANQPVSLTSDGGGGFLKMAEDSASDPSLSAGEGMFWVQNLTPNVPMFTDDANTDHQLAYTTDVHTAVQSASGIPSRTATITTNQGVGHTVLSNTFAADTVYAVEGRGVFSRGATATACTLTFELLLGGTVYATCSSATFTVAGTGYFRVRGEIKCLTAGALGTFVGNIDVDGDFNAGFDVQIGSYNTAASATTKDTTSTQSIVLRVTMSAAVAACSTFWTHAAVNKVI